METFLWEITTSWSLSSTGPRAWMQRSKGCWMVQPWSSCQRLWASWHLNPPADQRPWSSLLDSWAYPPWLNSEQGMDWTPCNQDEPWGGKQQIHRHALRTRIWKENGLSPTSTGSQNPDHCGSWHPARHRNVKTATCTQVWNTLWCQDRDSRTQIQTASSCGRGNFNSALELGKKWFNKLFQTLVVLKFSVKKLVPFNASISSGGEQRNLRLASFLHDAKENFFSSGILRH